MTQDELIIAIACFLTGFGMGSTIWSIVWLNVIGKTEKSKDKSHD